MDVNTNEGVVPRDAATVVVVRDAANGAGLEVLLMQRADRGDHNSGAWVFPGGLVDPADRETADPFRHTAIRECFEESGILFAVDGKGEWVSMHDDAGAQLAAMRQELIAGRASLADICGRHALQPAFEQLHFIAHWLTPIGRAKRFDTRFFLAIAPPGQAAMHDGSELLDHIWMPPAEALAPSHARRLMRPTRAMIEMVLPFADTRALGAWAAQPRVVERYLPPLPPDGAR